MRPARLDTFRFTTGSQTTAQAIAALYGGKVRQWEREFEVITGKSEIGVTVPPRDEVDLAVVRDVEQGRLPAALRLAARADQQRAVPVPAR